MKGGVLLCIAAFAVVLVARSAHADEDGRSQAGTASPPAEPGGFLLSENTGYGPLFIRSQAIFNQIRLSPLPLAPTTLRADEVEATFVVNWSNTFGEKDRYFVDYENIQLSLRATYAVTDKLSVTVELSADRRGGGSLDSFIEWFHRVTGLEGNDRVHFPKNQHILRFQLKNGAVVHKNPMTFGIEDLALTARYEITSGGTWLPAVAASVSASVPTGARHKVLGTGHPGIAASITASKGFGPPRDDVGEGRWAYVYAGVGFAYYGEEEILGLRLKTQQVSVFGGVEVRLTSDFALLGQVLCTTGETGDLPNFDSETYEIGAGLKWEVVPKVVFELGILEHVINLDPVDFGWHFGLTFRF